MIYDVTLIKKQIIVNVSHTALSLLSAFTSGQKVSRQKITAGKMAHFIKGMRRPFGFSLLSLKEAMNGSNTASTNLPEAAMTDMILSTPNNISCGMSGFKPALLGGK